MTLIRPMLAARSSGRGSRLDEDFHWYMDRGYVADTKLDGVRCMARLNQSTNKVQLWNRTLVDITHRYPDVVTQLTPVFLKIGPHIVLDGEIVASDGRFETTLLRDQQQNSKQIALMAQQHPATYIAFDWLSLDRNDWALIGVPWYQRRGALELFAGSNPELPITVVSTDHDFMQKTRDLGMEGVIVKNPNAIYKPAARNKTWVKFRNLFRVTVLVAGYTAGQGQRADFGAMELALLDTNGTPVSVGRCGTGFKEHEIALLKAHLDLGNTPLVVEIETVNQTKNHTLRFPVYKGIRSDVSPTDCTLDQLDGLPTC